MSSQKNFRPFLTVFLLALFSTALSSVPDVSVYGQARPAQSAAPPAVSTAPLVVRVAVISYDDYQVTFDRYEKTLKKLSAESKSRLKRQVNFRLTVGSYSDVLKWYTKDLVDIAILSPQPVVELRKMYGDEELARLYVATHDSDDQALTRRFDYRSMCVVNESSPIKDLDGLLAWAGQKRLNFLFVHPLSASGSIVPQFALSQKGVMFPPSTGATPAPSKSPAQNLMSWTYSNTATITALKSAQESALNLENSKSGKAQVGFIYSQPTPPGLRQIPFPGLDELKIPQEVVFINRTFRNHLSDMETLLAVNEASSRFTKIPNWLSKFDEVENWVRTANASSSVPESQNITLEQLGSILRKYEGRTNKPARVALVLSGGGAKCAYQLGAIQSIEDEISKKPDKGEKQVDLGLVVGTSGGAINALLVSMGLTRGGLGKVTVNNHNTLKAMWMQFDQKDFFQPYTPVNIALGLFVGLIQAVPLIGLSLLAMRGLRKRLLPAGPAPDVPVDAPPAGGRWSTMGRRLYLLPALVLLLFALLDYALYAFNWAPPWRWMGAIGMRHSWRHLWMLLALNLKVSAIALAVIAAGLILWQTLRQPLTKSAFLGLQLILSFFVVVCVVAVFTLSLFVQSTLSRSDGVEQMLSSKIQKLVSDRHPGGIPQEATLAELSGFVEKKLERDLVITGSSLIVNEEGQQSQTAAPLPEDLYFFYDHSPDGERAADGGERAPHDPAAPEATDPRFRKFDGALLDVVIGSTSIYPVFPYRRVESLNVNLIDGGFVHNSPIDAAVSWKATHIILIEASALDTTPPRQRYLLENASIAFNYLYTQAQILDARARGKVEIFTLRPTASKSPDKPDLCTFDFSDDFVEIAITKGINDASSFQPHFRREPGEPHLIDIGMEANQ